MSSAQLADVSIRLLLQYIAPELLFSGKYDGTRADTWCAGAPGILPD